MKEVTWSPGGLVLFIIREKKYSSGEPSSGTALLWHSTPTVGGKGRNGERESNSFSLRLLPFDESEKER